MSKSRRPAPRRSTHPQTNRLVFWPFPLLGNPGGDAGALALHDALRESLAEHFEEAESRLRPVAEVSELDVIEFSTPEDLLEWRSQLCAYFQKIRTGGDFPVVFGSNHLVALPILDAYAAEKRSVCVLQLDAHLDAYDLTSSREPLHHGSFLLHAKRRKGLSIVNVGHRDLTLSPERTRETFDRVWGIEEIAARPLEKSLAEIAAYVAGFDLVHVDIDADVLDPSVMRAVGTPMPCGLTGREVLAVCDAVPQKKLSGITLSEYSALLDPDASGRHLLTWMIERILLRRLEAAGR